MASVLSTKFLTASHEEAFRKAKIELTAYDAIQIEFIDFKIPEKPVENALFTSKNAVNAVFKNSAYAKTIKNGYCVGKKTAHVLSENGIKPLKIAQNAVELADYILKNHSEKEFHFFCGNKRREELPTILKKNNIPLCEIITYKTRLVPKQFGPDFNAVLFFSPSGIQSFVKKNDLSQKTAVCIGKTTATEAKKYTDRIEISNETTVESVVEKAIETCKALH